MLSNLFGIDLNKTFVDNFFSIIKNKYNIDFPRNNFIQGDVLFQSKEIKTDFLVGNPPWVNFTDLEDSYKEKIKPLFIDFNLVPNNKDLLLGSSRTDIATLILAKVIYDNLKDNGKAIFFLPLSIFQNDGANKGFRKYNIKGVDFCVEEIMDFNKTKIFKNVNSRYGLAFFQRNKKQTFPINYNILENEKWILHKAKPLFNLTNSLTVFDDKKSENKFDNFSKIKLSKHLKPRQGINTCGANDIFFFDNFKIIDKDNIELIKNESEKFIVNLKYVFPLTTSSIFKNENAKPEKLVLIPHSENGSPIDLNTLQNNEGLFLYFTKHKSFLENRKGVLINSFIKRGYWWALLGIGAYSFYSYKVMWKSFGDNIFSPKILSPDKVFGSWQGNQSLNAFIATENKNEAMIVLEKLSNPLIQDYLSSLKMQGTCNWAQPGRLKNIIEFI